MFGIKKKQKDIRRVHLDFAKGEAVKLKNGEEIEIWTKFMEPSLFKTKVESLAFQRSLQVLDEPKTDEYDNLYIRVRKV